MASSKSNIRETLVGKLAAERANIKGQEIAKLARTAREKRAESQYEIEVVSIEKIEKGIAVFARVWDESGQQIGFGKDGSVDVERFQIINPPILVADENGDVERHIPANTEIGAPEKTEKYREDLNESVMQVIEHNLSVMKNAHRRSKNIVAEKVGNTTTTVYSETDDGFIDNGGEDWDIVHDAGSGNLVNGDTSSTFFYYRNRAGAGQFTLRRSAFRFDTSAIPDADDIDSAIASFYGENSADGGYTSNTGEVLLVEVTPGNTSALAGGDFDQIGDAINNPTEGATRISIASWNTAGYNDFTLNATAEGWINKTGITALGIRSDYDAEDTLPTPQTGNGGFVTGYFADQTGTTNDPKLVVEHSVASTPQSLTANITGAASVATISTFGITLNAAVGVIAMIEDVKSLTRTLTASVTGAASIATANVIFKTLTASVTGAASIATQGLQTATLIASATANASITQVRSLTRTMVGSVTGSATISRTANLARTLVASATATATVTATKTFFQTLTAAVSAAANVTRGGIIFSRAITALVKARAALNEYFYKEKYTGEDEDYTRKY